MSGMCVTVCVHVHKCVCGGGGVTLRAWRSVCDGMYVRTYVCVHNYACTSVHNRATLHTDRYT